MGRRTEKGKKKKIQKKLKNIDKTLKRNFQPFIIQD